MNQGNTRRKSLKKTQENNPRQGSGDDTGREKNSFTLLKWDLGSLILSNKGYLSASYLKLNYFDCV